MCISRLDRRVQLLLDPQQYEDVEREAARSGQSVAAVIRAAIADRLASKDSARPAAAKRLLDSADSDAGPGAEWSEAKTAMEAELTSRLP